MSLRKSRFRAGRGPGNRKLSWRSARIFRDIPEREPGREFLKQGLVDFGIQKAPSLTSEVSHDELDAITSAIVGLFVCRVGMKLCGVHPRML